MLGRQHPRGRKISWSRLVMSSSARVPRRRSFVTSATSFRASIRAHVVCALSFPRYGRERVKLMFPTPQKRVRCPFMNSLPLSEWRERTRPGYLRRRFVIVRILFLMSCRSQFTYILDESVCNCRIWHYNSYVTSFQTNKGESDASHSFCHWKPHYSLVWHHDRRLDRHQYHRHIHRVTTSGPQH